MKTQQTLSAVGMSFHTLQIINMLACSCLQFTNAICSSHNMGCSGRIISEYEINKVVEKSGHGLIWDTNTATCSIWNIFISRKISADRIMLWKGLDTNNFYVRSIQSLLYKSMNSFTIHSVIYLDLKQLGHINIYIRQSHYIQETKLRITSYFMTETCTYYISK
jgi:hypothetical protein